VFHDKLTAVAVELSLEFNISINPLIMHAQMVSIALITKQLIELGHLYIGIILFFTKLNET
jgi:hypothetical protein